MKLTPQQFDNPQQIQLGGNYVIIRVQTNGFCTVVDTEPGYDIKTAHKTLRWYQTQYCCRFDLLNTVTMETVKPYWLGRLSEYQIKRHD